MDAGPDTEVLGRLASLDIVDAAYLRAVVKYPLRNVRLCQGEQIIKRHDGEPKPEPPKDPNLKKWSAHLIGGKKMQLLGFVEAVSEPAAIETAVASFGLREQQLHSCSRLAPPTVLAAAVHPKTASTAGCPASSIVTAVPVVGRAIITAAAAGAHPDPTPPAGATGGVAAYL
jgi:hypothetical protein